VVQVDLLNASKLTKLAEITAQNAGKCLLDAYSSEPVVLSDSGKDIKTEADKTAEATVLKAVQSTGYAILSEESGLSNTDKKFSTICESSLPIWIIDPLDGTYNFTRGFPMCCVSIALWQGLNPVLGVIYDFVSDTIYSGSVDNGASCNGKAIQVSRIQNHDQAALATGFPSSRDYSDAALEASIRSIQRFKKIRMIGSAALSLAHVSSGNVDAYMEDDIWLWDVAAGLALVKSAGGTYKISGVKDTFQLDVFAANGLLGN
jgi:myo-inositol-1(or 4)-monophosphatase